ncbi:hypothetical protein G6F45_009893 [Rhizopus arrhizus]|uniref:protein-tyrosine-phosphatase n=2 Tax=Rhizopus TaxID=4842 RepID=A0A9P7CL43_9FUNG|nr:hypothetical protein G6F52_007004 [Rhizopus delemar]KAG1565569.1 hypothetical protein G6F50_009954 [Rhizopus delemar]KAG1624598.1 hypothetical protein G6F45_009893 [Rhizopus arrhizus]KAG1639189.1 hypothetical protein G6F44_008080 [Rhizopus delemar]
MPLDANNSRAKPMEPSELGKRLAHNDPPLMIDMRPISDYDACHIRHSIHLDLPTLLVKRYQRGVISHFNLDHFITTGDYTSVVVYDDAMSQEVTWTLIDVLAQQDHEVYWLHHGFNAFQAWDTDCHYLTYPIKSPLQRRASLFAVDTERRGSVVRKEQQQESFVISEIVSDFLYLGPEITESRQLVLLKSRSIRWILNMAEECDDDIPGLKELFVYKKIPARDILDMKDVQDILKKAVNVINNAKRHGDPVYVHCQAGKSRSAAVILAYLILSEHRTLKQAYRLLVKARPSISPNIGFIAELLKLESSVHGKTSNVAEL